MGDDGHGSDLQVGESARSSAGPGRLERWLRSQSSTEPDDPETDRLADGLGWLTALAEEFGARDLAFDPIPGQLAEQLW
jgi:hypothetical protein